MIPTPIKEEPSKDYPQQVNNWDMIKTLEIVEERLKTPEAEEYERAPIDNREELQQLEVEQGRLSALIIKIGAGSLMVGLTTFSIALLGILLAWKPTTRLEKVSRVIKVIKTILEDYENAGVETLPFIKVPGYQPVDLFVRFPGKEFLLFALRSFGESTIIYNEHRKALFYKRPKNGLKKWEPDPLAELSEQAYWLRKNRRELFGSSKGVRKPMAKVLVVWNLTQLGEHNEHLYTTIGGKKFLFIPREGGACYVIHSSQINEFIGAWLVHRQTEEQAA